ncbi:MAG: hypothetical protein NT029_07015 [Armatimonadetes bacterium]|nr:hypothetical protein [Armatimonadota bacterium]
MSQKLWHEPKAYRRAVYYANERARPADSARFAAGAFAIMLGLRFIAGLRPSPDAHPLAWGPMAGLAAGVALFAAYGLPAILSFVAPSIVIVSDKGINNNRFFGVGWRIQFWDWNRIGLLATGTEALGDRTYRVVSLFDCDGAFLATLALAGDITPGDLARFAAAHGVEVEGEQEE